MKKFETILCDVKDEILTITLNRPDRLNAWNHQMLYDLIAAFDHADENDDVGAVVLTGAGRGFCAGADLAGGGGKTFSGTGNQAHLDELGDSGGAMSRRIFQSLKPVIVAFNGPAVGVGLTMTLAADIRIAAPNIKMGFVFAARGIIPEGCSSYFLPRLVGISKALEWCMSARVFRSEEALEAGLVRSIHDPEDLLPAAYGARPRVRRELASLERRLASDVLAHARRRRSDRRAQTGHRGHDPTRQVRRCDRGHYFFSREASREVSGQGERGSARVLPLVGGAQVPGIAKALEPNYVKPQRRLTSSVAMVTTRMRRLFSSPSAGKR